MAGKIKNDLEAAVQQELARQTAGRRGSSQAGAALRSSVSAAVARLSQSGFLSSRLPMEQLRKATSGLLGGKERVLCDCPVCRTDVLALALASLPPCYCRAEHYGIARGRVGGAALAGGVEAAIRKVTLRPRHPSRPAAAASGSVELVDFGVVLGARIVAPLLARIPGACGCELCQLDTLACGLNQMPAKYGVSIAGRYRVPASALEFMQHELVKGFAAAARKVAANPRHGGTEEF